MDARRLRTIGLVLFVIAFALGAFVAPTAALAQASDNPCPAGDSGKIDTTGDPATVTFTAPAGKLIWQYCVKAGSDGYLLIPVDPPSATVVIDHPTKDSVSNYSLYYVDADDEEECPEGSTDPECIEEEECPEGSTDPECIEEEPEGEDPEDEVLGERTDRGGSNGGDPDDPAVAGKRVAGRALPFTGIDPAPFIALSGLLAASGATALVIARRK